MAEQDLDGDDDEWWDDNPKSYNEDTPVVVQMLMQLYPRMTVQEAWIKVDDPEFLEHILEGMGPAMPWPERKDVLDNYEQEIQAGDDHNRVAWQAKIHDGIRYYEANSRGLILNAYWYGGWSVCDDGDDVACGHARDIDEAKLAAERAASSIAKGK